MHHFLCATKERGEKSLTAHTDDKKHSLSEMSRYKKMYSFKEYLFPEPGWRWNTPLALYRKFTTDGEHREMLLDNT